MKVYMLSPRYYQADAFQNFIDYSSEHPDENPLIVLPTGSGKSFINAMIIQDVIAYPKTRVLCLTHQKDLIQQNLDEYLGIVGQDQAFTVGVYSAGLRSRDTEQRIIFAGIQSVHSRAYELGRFSVVIIDECFTGETTIDTPTGMRRIDEVKKGDKIFNATGIGEVQSIFQRQSDDIITMEFSNGQHVNCTSNHPFFTDKGWIESGKMELGQSVFSRETMSRMWKTFLPVDKNSGQKDHIFLQRESMEQNHMLLRLLCEEIQESNERSDGSRKGKAETKRNWSQANNTWGKWSILGSAKKIIFEIISRLGYGTSDTNETAKMQSRISDMLQDRYCTSNIKNWNRSGWKNTCWETKRKGHKEEQIAQNIRLVNISYNQQGSRKPVYNLQVSNHPSYYANGILVHNCHRVPIKTEGTYRKFLNDMKKINKRCLIVGLSATPYRLKGGLLCDESHKERIFHEICHETTMTELMDANHKKNRDKQRYLCPLISKNSINRADMSGVSKTGGEYNAQEMETAFNKSDLVACAVKEIRELASDRKKILVFTSGIKHCEAVTLVMREAGFYAECVHSQKTDIENDIIKQKFRTGEINVLLNCDALTTGYNQKDIDCIAMLRSTLSPGLYVQIAGRGTRLHDDKENCLFLDFGGNILRHGPVDKIEIVRGGGKKKNGKVGTCPMKECPQCHNAIHLSVKICPECGYEYPEEEPKHDKEASDESILSGWKAPITVDVKMVSYSAHEKPGKTRSLRVDYYYNDMRGYYSEWVCLEHEGFAKNKAFQWVKTRLKEGITVSDVPTVDQVLERTDVLNEPKQIMVDFNEKFPRITGFIF